MPGDTATLHPALRTKCNAVRRLLAAADVDECRARHAVGVIVLDVQQSEDKYGKRAVGAMAAALGVERSALYCHGQVAATFKLREVESLLRATKSERPLSWWHLCVLARVADPKERDELARRARRGLSVRELKRVVRQEREGSAPDGVGSVERRLRTLLSVTESLRGRATLGEIAAPLSTEAAELVERVVAAQKELREICERNLERLEAVRGGDKNGAQLRKAGSARSTVVAASGGKSGLLLAGCA